LIPLLMDRFSFDMVYDSTNIFRTLIPVIRKSDEGSALYLACNAIARAYMLKTVRMSNYASQVKAYGAALAAVKFAIRDPVLCRSDNTLIGVWLLVLYEVRRRFVQILHPIYVDHQLG
jgi:hypothetical protein